MKVEEYPDWYVLEDAELVHRRPVDPFFEHKYVMQKPCPAHLSADEWETEDRECYKDGIFNDTHYLFGFVEVDYTEARRGIGEYKGCRYVEWDGITCEIQSEARFESGQIVTDFMDAIMHAYRKCQVTANLPDDQEYDLERMNAVQGWDFAETCYLYRDWDKDAATTETIRKGTFADFCDGEDGGFKLPTDHHSDRLITWNTDDSEVTE